MVVHLHCSTAAHVPSGERLGIRLTCLHNKHAVKFHSQLCLSVRQIHIYPAPQMLLHVWTNIVSFCFTPQQPAQRSLQTCPSADAETSCWNTAQTCRCHGPELGLQQCVLDLEALHHKSRVHLFVHRHLCVRIRKHVHQLAQLATSLLANRQLQSQWVCSDRPACFLLRCYQMGIS